MRVPTPKLVTAQTSYGACYAWSCENKRLGLRVLGDSRKEAQENYIEAVKREFPNTPTDES